MKTNLRHIPIAIAATVLATVLVGCHGSDNEDPAAAAENFSLKASKLPKAPLMASAIGPLGSPPPFGAMLFQ